MKIKDSFLLKNVAGKMIVVPTGEATLDFNAVITLNETGAFLFDKLQKDDLTDEQLADALLTEYEVDRETALCDIRAFMESIEKANIIEK